MDTKKIFCYSLKSIICLFFLVMTTNLMAHPFPALKRNSENFTWEATADSLQKVTYTTFITPNGTFKHDNKGNVKFNYWWNAHMLDVYVDGYNRTKDKIYLPRMKALLHGIKSMNDGEYPNVYNDDMEWLAIACLRAYEATNDKEYKRVARILWEEVKKGWNDNLGGGIMWRTDTPKEKNACSNGPAVILAARLYQIEKNPEDLKWAKKIYKWLSNTLIDPVTGLVWDNISLNNGKPVINKRLVLTYNQGTYIGAATELYQITNDQKYLRNALKTASAVIKSPRVTFEGMLRNEGQGDAGLFKGIFVRNLALLIQNPDISEKDRKKLQEFLTFNAQMLYLNGIDRTSMMVSSDWTKKPEAQTDFSTQLSGAMLMEVAARLNLSQKKVIPKYVCDGNVDISNIRDFKIKNNKNEKYLIVVLGSSTAAGFGPSKKEDAWVWRYKYYLSQQISEFNLINLARGGYSTEDILPTGDPKRNITKAISLAPDAIIINLPSNDAAQGRPVKKQINNYKTIAAIAAKNDIPLWVTTPQPRNFKDNKKIRIQRDMVDATYVVFEEPVNLWTCFSDKKGFIKPKYDSADGIHLNDLAHQIIFERMVKEKIPQVLAKSSLQTFK